MPDTVIHAHNLQHGFTELGSITHHPSNKKLIDNKMSSPRKHVEGGYCIQNDGGVGRSFCALEAGQCDLDNEEWRSSRQAFSAGLFQKCVTRSEVRDVYVGTCGNACAPDAESCANGEFTPPPLFTGNVVNADCMVSKATFGNCDGRCVWSADECEAGETFRLPGSGGGGGNGGGTGGGNGGGNGKGRHDECTCDKVQVGGCKTPDTPIYCAVSPDSCDEFQTYLTPQQVQEQENWSCYLCREKTTPSSMSPTSAPTRRIDDPTNMLPVNNPSSPSSNRGAIIGGSIAAGAVGIVILLGVIYGYRYKKTRKHSPPKPSHVDPVIFSDDGVVSDIE